MGALRIEAADSRGRVGLEVTGRSRSGSGVRSFFYEIVIYKGLATLLYFWGKYLISFEIHVGQSQEVGRGSLPLFPVRSDVQNVIGFLKQRRSVG